MAADPATYREAIVARVARYGRCSKEKASEVVGDIEEYLDEGLTAEEAATEIIVDLDGEWA